MRFAIGLVVLGLLVASAQAQCPDGYGDVTGPEDGLVNVADATCAITAILANLQGEDPAEVECVKVPATGLDMSGEGSINVVDAAICIALALDLPLGDAIDKNANACPDAFEVQCGDATCSDALGESCLTCPFDCGECTNLCCEPHDGAGCVEPAVEACTCAISSFCCDFIWDQSCADLAVEFCNPTCEAPPCPAAGKLSCGQTLLGSTPSGTEEFASYSCSEGNWAGKELIYSFTATDVPGVQIEIEPLGAANLGLFILDDACENQEGCLAEGATVASTAVPEGETVYVVVDSAPGAGGAFNLSVTCADECDVEELCGGAECGGVECAGLKFDCGTCNDGFACSAGVCTEITVPGCPGSGSCAVANDSPGCDDAACCAEVCTEDPFCCDTSWDGACAEGALFICFDCDPDLLCGALECGTVFCGASAVDCGACPPGEFCNFTNLCEPIVPNAACPGDGDCFASNGSTGCNIDTCCNKVCSLASFCCDFVWDSECAFIAGEECFAVCGDGVCDGDLGETCSDCPEECLCGDGATCEEGECIGGTPCPEPIAIGCGETMGGDLSAAPGSITNYSCATAYGAGEIAYAFTAAENIVAIADVIGGAAAGIEAFSIENECNAQNCVGEPGVGVAAELSAGETTYFVVDGPFGASTYELAITCVDPCDPTVACEEDSCGVIECNGPAGTVDCGGCEPGFLCDDESNTCESVFPGCPGTTDCTVPSSISAGCSDALCCSSVCSVDPFCCDIAWETFCVQQAFDICYACDPELVCGSSCGEVFCGEDVFSCGGCPSGSFCAGGTCLSSGCGPGSGDCFANNGSPGCDNPICCESICATDSFCCQTSWDDICADAAALEPACTAVCGDGVCESDKGENCATCAEDCPCAAGLTCNTDEGTCGEATECPEPVQLVCGETFIGDFSAAPSTTSVYDCSTTAFDGGEFAYVFTSEGTTALTVSLETDAPGAQLLQMNVGGECGGNACDSVALGGTAGLELSDGQTLAFVAESLAASSGTFSLNVQCDDPCAPEVFCGDADCGEFTCLGSTVDCGGCGEDAFCVFNACLGPPAECPGTGSCNVPNGSVACDDAECCSIVCLNDPFCCDTEWDDICAEGAAELCP